MFKRLIVRKDDYARGIGYKTVESVKPLGKFGNIDFEGNRADYVSPFVYGCGEIQTGNVGFASDRILPAP